MARPTPPRPPDRPPPPEATVMHVPTETSFDLTLCQQGYDAPLAAVLERYAGRVLAWCGDCLWGDVPGRAELQQDVAQQVLLLFVRRHQEGRPMTAAVSSRSHFQALVWKVIRLRVRNALRDARAKGRAAVSLDAPGPDGRRPADDWMDPKDPDASLAAIAMRDIFRVVVERLRDDARLLAVLMDQYEGLTEAKSAERQNVSPSTIRRQRGLVKDLVRNWFPDEVAADEADAATGGDA